MTWRKTCQNFRTKSSSFRRQKLGFPGSDSFILTKADGLLEADRCSSKSCHVAGQLLAAEKLTKEIQRTPGSREPNRSPNDFGLETPGAEEPCENHQLGGLLDGLTMVNRMSHIRFMFWIVLGSCLLYPWFKL